ncbi:MAG: GerMN domain-containing protein [Spirochaetota bacterium]
MSTKDDGTLPGIGDTPAESRGRKSAPTTAKKGVPKRVAGSRAKAAAGKRRTRRKKESYTRPLLILLVMGLATAVLVLSSLLIRKNSTPLDDRTETVTRQSVERTQDPDDTVLQHEAPSTETEDVAAEEGTGTVEDEPTASLHTVRLYYIYYDETADALAYRPVEASVEGENIHEATLRRLFQGPENASLKTSLPESVGINAVRVTDNVAYIDLTDGFTEGAYGDIATSRVNQILLTMMQFQDVSAITISVNGRVLETMGDGRRYTWPLQRIL